MHRTRLNRGSSRRMLSVCCGEQDHLLTDVCSNVCHCSSCLTTVQSLAQPSCIDGSVLTSRERPVNLKVAQKPNMLAKITEWSIRRLLSSNQQGRTRQDRPEQRSTTVPGNGLHARSLRVSSLQAPGHTGPGVGRFQNSASGLSSISRKWYGRGEPKICQ